MNHYDVGDLVKIQGTFTDSAGEAVEPNAVFVKVKPPTGTMLSYEYTVDAEVVWSSKGIYYVHVDADEHGIWLYRFSSTGAGQAADELSFIVDDSQFD